MFNIWVGVVWLAAGLSAFVFMPALYVLVPLMWLTLGAMLLRRRRR